METVVTHEIKSDEVIKLREEVYSLKKEVEFYKNKIKSNFKDADSKLFSLPYEYQHPKDHSDILKQDGINHSHTDEYEKIRYQSLIDDLQKRNEELMQFSYIISHNVRAPVASILGLVDLINNTKKPETVLKSTNMLLESALNLDNIFKDLDKILNSKRTIDDLEIIFFDDILSGISYMLNDSIVESKAFFEIDFLDCPCIKSTKGHIQSIFYNLISNSIKYQRENINPLIRIKSTKEADQVVLTFSDNGLGIDLTKFKSKIFGLYQRFHLHTEGKGIGLHLVKSHIEALRGKIEVKSEPNAGTSFIIKFPISQQL